MPITLSPKTAFLADKASAARHSDLMASPPFHAAVSAALLEYQRLILPSEPTVLAIAASKLKGAQEFLAVLMNLGLPERGGEPVADFTLRPPEAHLDAR